MNKDHAEKISAAKKGKPRTAAHNAAIKKAREGRLAIGDCISWFGEKGRVIKKLGVQALWPEHAVNAGGRGGPAAMPYRITYEVRLEDSGFKLLTEDTIRWIDCDETAAEEHCAHCEGHHVASPGTNSWLLVAAGRAEEEEGRALTSALRYFKNGGYLLNMKAQQEEKEPYRHSPETLEKMRLGHQRRAAERNN